MLAATGPHALSILGAGSTFMQIALPSMAVAAARFSASAAVTPIMNQLQNETMVSMVSIIPTPTSQQQQKQQQQRFYTAKPAPSFASSDIQSHPGSHGTNETALANNLREDTYFLMQPHYPDKAYLEGIKPFHRKPVKLLDYTGYYGVKALRSTFDAITGYGPNSMNERKWLTRFLFLETVAGVPGFIGGALRHFRSLRTMKRDGGWIHTLLEEAENERMHLLTFMELSKPEIAFRSAVIGTQGIFLALYTAFYAISPRHCHAFVSYLEEEAVKTYSHCIDDLDAGKLPEWNTIKIPDIAKKYWRLPEDASMRDLLLAIRADELCHNEVNRVFAELKSDDPNPFAPGTTIVA